MTEADNGYKFKHSKRVSLDSYNGVAEGIMHLNDPIADEFMRRADIRYDVKILQRSHSKVYDYDEVGFVKVAKVLNLPRIDFWQNKGLTSIKRENKDWIIAIDDQGLADQVAREDHPGKNFNEAFVESFQEELKKGLTACLRREKLLNAGHYNSAFFINYHAALWYALIAGIPLFSYFDGKDVSTALLSSSALFVSLNAVKNSFNLVGVLFRLLDDKVTSWLSSTSRLREIKSPYSSFDEPFIRQSLFELPLPVIPVDRLFLGLDYLNRNGSKLINH